MKLRISALKKNYLFAAVAIVLALGGAAAYHVELRNGYEGIFLLKGDGISSFRITDDLFHGEQEKLLLSFFLRPHDSELAQSSSAPPMSLSCNWNEKTGRGYVINHYPNGTKLVTCFSRFIEGSGRAPSGLFVGGNLPFSLRLAKRTAPNATGMSFYDGARWNHIWCSVNEAILTDGPQPLNVPPSRMKFLGSRILSATDEKVAIMSNHEVKLGDATLLMERYALFSAGDIHFTLVTRIRNVGKVEANFSYVYGDEPWVGNYGTSRGDVGWLQDSIINVEGSIDTDKYSYAGIFDYGNPLINESHNFTRMASFIEWLGEKPDVAFFSNNPGYFDDRKKPLSSDTRFLGLQWGPRSLAPGDSRTYVLAIGMAGRDAMSGFPVKPQVEFPHEAYRKFVK
ncbi:hypothetical protein [Geobacter sp. DSM 9736]|uniref:hypothetical protein n=1 Tax=Geobacter sp. DSM 9736 TaxID=1277350 RepID=UPI000B506D47|nr:hypothetical protein [Geobacter sp. DSM 9736]SNB45003.1 hypothetical protein SAMN06269301_0397 [Geobacter sp. DSM 9736]